MGEIADSMIEGELCQFYGEYLGEACGYPRSCGACGGDKQPKGNDFKFRRTDEFKLALEKSGINYRDAGNHTLLIRQYNVSVDVYCSTHKWKDNKDNNKIHHGDEKKFMKWIAARIQ